MNDRLIKRNYQVVEVDAECELYFSDIMDAVLELNKSELKELYKAVVYELELENMIREHKTLNDVMKEEWWNVASKKFTLEELENKLGNKYDLI